MAQIKLGNVQPEVECKVIFKIVFTGSITNEKTFFINFPIDNYSSKGLLDSSSLDFPQLSFQLQCDSEKVSKVTSNIQNSTFDEVTKIFSINDSIKTDNDENTINLTFDMKDLFQNTCFLRPTDTIEYDFCAISLFPNLPPKKVNSEFIFIVSCGRSMKDESIKKASECLIFFIKSLPINSI